MMLCRECNDNVLRQLSSGWFVIEIPTQHKRRGDGQESKTSTALKVSAIAKHECYICHIVARYGPSIPAELTCKQLCTSPRQKFAWDHDIPRSTGDKRVLRTIRQWLSECLESHGHCAQDQRVYTPQRLIDTQPRTLRKFFHVVDTGDLPLRPQYITLSHRWDTETPTLSSKTTAKYRKDTLWVRIPKVYQDAFATVSALGYRYIWIDSLCISQDDRQDMLSEGLTMMQVYSGAVCNLSALEGHSKAMFATRHPSHVGTAQKLSDVPGALSQRQVVLVDYDLWRAEVDSAPLNQRGWVFQERMIAPRTVFFSKNQMLWECRRGRRCESYPAGEGTSNFTRNKSVHSGALDPQYCLIREMKSGPRKVHYLQRRTWENLWNVLVERYVALTISFREDKLIAIAGIAKLFEKSSSLTWAAGLWKEHMPNCLLWYAYQPSLPCERTYFPTWSWASSAGKVNIGPPLYPSNREVARVIQVECMTVGDDPFGILTSASLLLEAPMMEVLLDEGDRQLALSLCGEVFLPDVIMPDRHGLPFVGREMLQWKPDPGKLELRHQESAFVAVVLDTHARQLTCGQAEIHLRGLILEELQHASPNSFDLVKWRRAAFFNVNGPVVVVSSPILQSEIFSFSKRVYLEVGVDQTHQPLDFNTATCLQTFDIV